MKYPKLSTEDQIKRMESLGITFNGSSREDAKKYMENNNNYFKLTAYRKSFQQYPDGDKKDKYIDLDFSYLKDLAIIDMRLRYILLLMCLDIEHFSKVRLMNFIRSSEINGYGLVNSFRESLPEDNRKALESELARNKNNTYCGDLIDQCITEMPVWAFIELIPFGRYIYFYKHCADRLNNKKLENEHYLLLDIKELRNAAAHNNCILNNLHPDTCKFKTNYAVSRRLDKTKALRKKRMSNERMRQIVTLLYTYGELVTSPEVRKHQWEILEKLSNRLFKNIEYYKNTEMIPTTFTFLKDVIDNLKP